MRILSCLFLLLCAFCTNAADADLIYTMSASDGVSPTTLVQIDAVTGNTTVIGSTGTVNVQALAYDSANDVLYAGGFVSPDFNSLSRLYTVDRNTGALTEVGGMGTTRITGLAYDRTADVLYGVSQVSQQLATVNRATGEIDLIGPLANAGAASIADAGLNGELVFAGTAPAINGVRSFGTVSKSTGQATVVTDTGTDRIFGMDYSPANNRLYGITAENGFNLFLFNRMTGARTLLHELDPIGIGFSSLAVIPQSIPEPSTTFMMLVSIAALGARRRNHTF